MSDDDERRMVFEALVLQGIWLIVRMIRKHRHEGNDWRGSAINYMDAYGLQHDEAKRHRREKGFPE